MLSKIARGTALVTCLIAAALHTAEAESKRAVVDVLICLDKTAAESIKSPLQIRRGNGETMEFPAMSAQVVAEFAVAEINSIMNNSGIGDNVLFRLAGCREINYTTQAGVNGKSAGVDVDTMRMGNIENLDEAQQQHKADLVIMLTSYPLNGNCTLGIAHVSTLNCHFAKEEHTFDRHATFHVAAVRTGNPVFSHETCHLFGAGHADKQLAQCGPQCEMDAAGYYTDDSKYNTLMSYEGYHDVDDSAVPTPNNYKSTNILRVLSTDRMYRQNDFNGIVGHRDTNNNAAVVLRHASAISMYDVSGNEQILNDDFDGAIPMPAVVPYSEKEERILRGRFFGYLNYMNEKNLISIADVWEKRFDHFKNERLEFKKTFISPEFHVKKPQDCYISCVYGTNHKAGQEPGEPQLPGGKGQSVWYTVTAPVDGHMEIGIRRSLTTNGFQPVLGAFIGNTPGRLHALEMTNVTDEHSDFFIERVRTEVRANEKIYIMVDSKTDERHFFTMSVKIEKGECSREVILPPLPEPTADTPTGTPAEGERPWQTLDTVLLGVGGGALTGCLFLSMVLCSGNKKKDPGKGSQPGNPWVLPEKTPSSAQQQTVAHQSILLQGTLSDGQRAEYTISLADVAAKHNYYLGRNKACDTVINDATVSKCHAMLMMAQDARGAYLVIRDAGSSNGTMVDGVRATQDKSIKIRHNSQLNLGQCKFRVTNN